MRWAARSTRPAPSGSPRDQLTSRNFASPARTSFRLTRGIYNDSICLVAPGT